MIKMQLNKFDSVKKTDDEVISVSQLNRMAKNMLETHLPVMWIKGEVSGLKSYAHLYFDLKDDGAKISCVMFAKLASVLDFPLENGTKIEVRGRVTIYLTNGSYQINVERVRKVGLGELWEAYSRLIVKLREDKLFDAIYKKPIPVFPRSIGVITSKEGSVIRDVVTTLKRRMPNIPLVVYHSAVQGSDAAMQLVKAIRVANERREVDVLIICRGGGSMEDLWCFNDESVAREVFQSHLPIISAVGHETDTTIIDFVSDLRAPTPTAAAELVAKSRNEWLDDISNLSNYLNRIMLSLINEKQQHLDFYFAKLKFLNPVNQLQQKQIIIKKNEQYLRQVFNRYIIDLKWKISLYQSKLCGIKIDTVTLHERLNQSKLRLSRAINIFLLQKQTYIKTLESNLQLINPQQVLVRGYSIVRDSNGQIIRDINSVKHNSRVCISIANGNLSAIVDKHFNPEQRELL